MLCDMPGVGVGGGVSCWGERGCYLSEPPIQEYLTAQESGDWVLVIHWDVRLAGQPMCFFT